MRLFLIMEWMQQRESGMLPLLFFMERVSMQRDNQWKDWKPVKGKDMHLHRRNPMKANETA